MKLLHLAEWHGRLCPYCERPMAIGTLRKPTRDHVIPRDRGMKLTPDNKIVVCAPCNGDKKNRSLQEFYESLRKGSDPRARIINTLIRIRLDAGLRS